MFKLIKKIISNSDKKVKLDIVYNEYEACPECSGDLVLKEGKFGKFWSCIKYPKCNGTRSYYEYIETSDFFGEQKISFVKHLSVVSGLQKCYACKKQTRVSGLALIDSEISFIKDSGRTLASYGYDLYTVPWSSVLEELPKPIRDFVLERYAIEYKYSKTTQEKNWANVCEYCKKLQGNFYVYYDTGHGSPFDVYSNEKLTIEQFPLKEKIVLPITIESEMSPKTNFLKRSVKRIPISKLATRPNSKKI